MSRTRERSWRDEGITVVTNAVPVVVAPARGIFRRRRPLAAAPDGTWDASLEDRAPQWHGSHPAVTRSLLLGLAEIGYAPLLNPSSIDAGHAHVACLAGRHTVPALLDLRRHDLIARLVIGPNTHVTPEECAPIADLERADAVIAPSAWVATVQAQMAGSDALPLRVWAAGTDTHAWMPASPRTDQSAVLVYDKARDPGLIEQVEAALTRSGRSWRTLRYGEHDSAAFKAHLDASACVVYLGASESQGLALQEAWSTDRPTFVYDAPHTVIQYSDGITTQRLERGQFSPAPYLTAQTGALWQTTDHLLDLLGDAPFLDLHPRAWVLEHRTLADAARRYLEILVGPALGLTAR